MLFFLLLSLLALSSCGYQLAGLSGGPAAPRDAIAVSFFVNATDEPLIEEELTPRLRQEFVRDGRLNLVDGPRAVWFLRGRITSYSETPLSFDAAQNVLEYRVTITANVDLKRQSTGETAWTQIVSGSAEYPVTSDVMATRLGKRQAIAEAAGNLSQDLVDRLIGGY
ncbi:MAG: LptE family protein [Nitrospirae bacterium]|nr:LptE family protein [Nitrospirota bacterium]